VLLNVHCGGTIHIDITTKDVDNMKDDTLARNTAKERVFRVLQYD